MKLRAAARCSLPFGVAALSLCGRGQSARGDFERALALPEHYRGLIDHLPDSPEWSEGSSRFICREILRAAPGESENGFRFVVVDAATRTSQPAFDAQRLVEALTKASGGKFEATHLPFTRFHFQTDQKSILFNVKDTHWTCQVAEYTCTKENRLEHRDPEDEGYESTPKPDNGDEHAIKSPDGRWSAFVANNNLVIRQVRPDTPAPSAPKSDRKDENQPTQLSLEGSADNYYAVSTIAWSLDSKYLAAYRIRPGYRRVVDYVESSPPNQLQPIHSTMIYPKAGDVLSFYQPVLFDLVSHEQFEIDPSVFPNQFEVKPIEW